MNNNNLIQDFESICAKIVQAFCEKQDLEFSWWVADYIGGVTYFDAEYLFSFDDIIFDLKTSQPKGKILDWYNSTLEYIGTDRWQNYYAYSKGVQLN